MDENICTRILTRVTRLFAMTLLVSACSSRANQATTPTPAQPTRSPSPKPTVVIDFNAMGVGRSAPGFSTALTGGGGAVAWSVESDGANKVLAQTSNDDTDYRFPLCIYEGFSAADVSLACRFKAVAGKVDQAGGLVARYADANNYYIVRANALEDNVRLYRVVDGHRQQFAGEKHKVTSGQWHDLRLDVRGKHFAVFFDGEKLFEADDETFAKAGMIGLWTKADSVTWFDDLNVAELPR